MNIPEGYIGLCSLCILNLNASSTPRVGRNNRGMAKDREGEIIELSGGRRFEWKPGNYLPPGAPYLSELILILGEGVDFETWNGPFNPYAVTMNNGSLVCDQHNGELFQIGRR